MTIENINLHLEEIIEKLGKNNYDLAAVINKLRTGSTTTSGEVSNKVPEGLLEEIEQKLTAIFSIVTEQQREIFRLSTCIESREQYETAGGLTSDMSAKYRTY
jgi:uncharacterized membrane protein YgaE (UPF0421/DUF939 family)